MPRQAKEYKVISMKMELALHEQLEDYCKETGQTKTKAIERAVSLLIADHEEKQKIIEAAVDQKKMDIGE